MPVSFAKQEVSGTLSLSPQIQFRRFLIFLGALLLAAAFACSPARTPTQNSSTVQLTDDAGRVVNVPQRVDRVITLAPNLTEIVFAIGAGDRLVGNMTYCDYPPEAKNVAKIGDTLHPNLERIIALKPQVVLVSTASQLETFTQQLQNQNIVAFVTDPHDLYGVFRSIEQVGQIMGQQQQANASSRNCGSAPMPWSKR